MPDDNPPRLGLGPIRQNGYVVRDMDAALTHWTTVLGAGPFYLVESVELDWYRCGDSTTPPELSIALGNSGPLQIELIYQRDQSPSMYLDFLDDSGPGLHHVAFWSMQYDTDYDRLAATGLAVGQEGQIGGPKGRFAYFETHSHPGSLLELSDISGPKGEFFEHIRRANENWNGSRPVRPVSG